MFLLSLFLLAPDNPTETLAKKMLPIYEKEAADYRFAVESAPKKDLDFKKEPIFEWSNPVREGLQQGVLFLWTRDGRPAALGCIFSQPHDKPVGRQIIHEMHALDSEKLLVSRPSGVLNQWKPEAGLVRKELMDSPAAAGTPGGRLVQMRRLAQEFSGYTVDRDMKRWDLRLLPAPLFRYPAAKTGIIDGAIFTLVSTAGTDPEVLLLIEAKETNGKVKWEYALGRFSDRDLHVQRNEKDLWSLTRNELNSFNHDPQHLYRLYADKVVSEDGKVLARVRVTEKQWWGEVVPLDEK